MYFLLQYTSRSEGEKIYYKHHAEQLWRLPVCCGSSKPAQLTQDFFFLTCFKRIPCSDTNRVCISDLETLAKKQQNIASFLNLALSRKVGAANRVSARLPSSRSYRWRLFVESNLSAVCEQFCVFLYVIRSFFHPPTLTPLSSALFTKCDRR